MSFFYTAKTKSEILTQLSTNKQLKDASKNLIKNSYVNIHEDLFQDLFLYLCDLPEEKIVDLYQQENIIFYCITIMQNKTKKGKFAKHYIQRPRSETPINIEWLENIPEDKSLTEEELKQEKVDYINWLKNRKIVKLPKKVLISKSALIQNQLKNHHWYDQKIFIDLYLQRNMTIRQIAEQTQIPVTSIHSTIHKIIKELKNEFNQKGFNDFV